MAKIGLYPSGGHLVKRVIGVAGDTIHCCDKQGRILVNGHPLDEGSYVKQSPGMACNGPMTTTCNWTAGPVPEGKLFVMGDNRDNSDDSSMHLCQPKGSATDCTKDPYVAGRRRRRQGVRAAVAQEPLPRAAPPGRLRRRPERVMTRLPHGATVRRDAGLYGYERALRRVGHGSRRRASTRPGAGRAPDRWWRARRSSSPARPGEIPGLADSKLLTEKARERCYDQILRRALSWSVVVIESDECDRLGMHVANIEALRRAVALLDVPPQYVLTDGFPVDGLGGPGSRSGRATGSRPASAPRRWSPR